MAPRLAVPTDEGRRAPLPDDDPAAAEYLGLDRWSCDEIAEVTGGRARRLTAEQPIAGDPYCYVLNGGSGEPFAPPRGGEGPWQAGVLYTADDPAALTLDEILDAGGVLLSVDFGVTEPAPPADRGGGDGGDPSSMWTEVGGEPAVLHRTGPARLAGVWFAGEPTDRVRVILMTGGDEQRALDLMAAVETGAPLGEAPRAD